MGNRVAWAKTYLQVAGLVESPKLGIFRATMSGIELLRHPPGRIDIAFLTHTYSEFAKFRTRVQAGGGEGVTRTNNGGGTESKGGEVQTPEEQIDAAHGRS